MLAIAKAFLDNPELQVAVIGALTWAIMLGLKKVGVIPVEGANWPKRLYAAFTAGVVGLVGAFVAAQTTGDPVDWGKLAAAVILAWVAGTGIHTLTRKAKAA